MRRGPLANCHGSSELSVVSTPSGRAYPVTVNTYLLIPVNIRLPYINLAASHYLRSLCSCLSVTVGLD